MEHVSLDLWAANLEARGPDLDSWLLRLEERLRSAAARASQMLVLPEYTCAQWLSFAPADLAPAGQLGWLAAVGEGALVKMAALSTRYGVSIAPGTIPVAIEGESGERAYANRAWLLTPDGGAFHQDKLTLTPMEENGVAGVSVGGGVVNVIPWNGLRVAMIVCLDVEYTALWARLGRLDLDLVIVSAKTEMISGYYRVFSCARTRAIELQTVVCVVGAVGEPLGHPTSDPGIGGAGAYMPCDVSLDSTGIFAELPPQSAAAGADPVLAVQNLPVGQSRRIRNGAAEAEVCPASWLADHVEIRDLSPPAGG